MRAAYVEELGGPEQVRVGEMPEPEPGEAKVLVRVMSASVGPWDVKMMAGRFRKPALPFVPGMEVAGIVESTGGVEGLAEGDHIFGRLSIRCGGLAEKALAEPTRWALIPPGTSFDEAAALVIAAGTAHEGLERARLGAGETLLVTAAAGGVGSMVVQIAADMGARVLAVAGARNRDYLRDLGAAEVFDYRAADYVDRIRDAAPEGVEVLFDGAGGETRDRMVSLVRANGRAVFIAGAPESMERGISAESFSASPDRARLAAIARLVQEGRLRVVVEQVFPLEEAARALERVASGHTRGKIVVKIQAG